MKKNEATLISYKLVIDQKGKVYSERSVSDIDQLEERFTVVLFNTLKTVLRNTTVELDKIHNKLEVGIFGADMEINLINDGPVTFLFKSTDFKKHFD